MCFREGPTGVWCEQSKENKSPESICRKCGTRKKSNKGKGVFENI